MIINVGALKCCTEFGWFSENSFYCSAPIETCLCRQFQFTKSELAEL